MEKEEGPVSPSTDETLDAFFNGELRVIQKKEAYRFSIDAILLSEFVALRPRERVIDLGTGCGILPLLLSKKSETATFVGVEIQKSLVECAVKNVHLNRLQERITILQDDFRKLRDTLPPASFDVVISNPPYRKAHSGRVNPSFSKAMARHEIHATLDDLTSLASYLLPNKGRCYLIYPASRLVDLLVSLRREKLEPKRLQSVHPFWGEKAVFVVVESIKSSGAELTLMPPRILHPGGRDGKDRNTF
ncbi:MAG: tRNA1(Val) (adenine(37)-N6)-methyltransferase [Desulfobacterota bacterium]|nr:tRNA1(Val) (adenine(37)-N6)-methyltransferase [Thermodesulfobacteriota bacterium]